MKIEKWGGTHIDLVYNDVIAKIAPKGKILGVGDSCSPHGICNMKYFHDCPVDEGVCLNITPGDFKNLNGFDELLCNAHNIPYNDDYFDFVYTVMMLEHDPEFWLSVKEMRRVLKPGCPLMIAIPGFIKEPEYVVSDPRDHWGHGVSCYENHTDCDCYRFSPDFFRFFALKDFNDAIIYHTMFPPRLIGIGYK